MGRDPGAPRCDGCHRAHPGGDPDAAADQSAGADRSAVLRLHDVAVPNAPHRHGETDQMDHRSDGDHPGGHCRGVGRFRGDRVDHSVSSVLNCLVNAKWPPSRVATSQFKSGGVLLSHEVPIEVPSALKVLASGFGM